MPLTTVDDARGRRAPEAAAARRVGLGAGTTGPEGRARPLVRLRGLRPARHAARVLASAGLSMAMAAQAAVSERTTITRYAVKIEPGAPMAAAFNAASPIREGGKVYHGHTRWKIRWSFRWTTDAGGICRISATTTTLDVDMVLPEPDGGSARQRQDIAAYMKSLIAHEDGHRDLARRAAREVDEAIAATPGSPQCATLEERANTLGMQVVQRYAELERRYDRDTDHGRTQGALLAGDL